MVSAAIGAVNCGVSSCVRMSAISGSVSVVGCSSLCLVGSRRSAADTSTVRSVGSSSEVGSTVAGITWEYSLNSCVLLGNSAVAGVVSCGIVVRTVA